MTRTEVTELADRSIRSVSGGERQRVLLARALAQETPVLALDEPTASLDINHQVRTLELVRELVDEGKTVVAAIHDLNLAAHYCDELQLLSQAEMVASGPPAAVLTSANLEDAFETNAVVTRHPVTGSVYVSALPDTHQQPSTGSVHVVGGGGTASRLLYVLSAAGFEVSVGALNEGDADLETARALGLDVVTTPPYSPIDAETASTVRERVRATDVTVLADIEVWHGNLPNLAAAGESDSLVVVEERPFEDRNYAGHEARALYTSLRSSGSAVEPDDVLDAVVASVPGDRAPV
jgi:iron complex transport system ATP-binding protein